MTTQKHGLVPIGAIVPTAIETLERPTKANPRNTVAWGKLADFIVPKGDKQLAQMKEEAASFIDDIANNRTPRWLSLLGTSGAGKTMLAKIIARYFRQTKHMQIDWDATRRTQTESTPRGRIIRDRGGFINWGDAINNRMLRGDYDFLEDMREYSFFAIDDIASEYERHRALSASKLYNVFEARLRKWTVVTANLSLEQIGETLDARIASRMMRDNGVVVDVDVPDWNLRGITP
jgi:DNA replication protein DnaC